MKVRLFVLMAHDPETGFASAAVGVLGVAEGEGEAHEESVVSWLPFAPADASGWMARLAEASLPVAEAVDVWLASANGVSWDLVELDPASAACELRGAVELEVDDLMVLLAVPEPGLN